MNAHPPPVGHHGRGTRAGRREQFDCITDAIAGQRSQGGWVVIASALRARLPESLEGTLDATRRYIIQADVWYGCDTLAERVPGQALVDRFHDALQYLSGWRMDANFWVRRAAGVAGHFWFKRAHGEARHEQSVLELLNFYRDMLGESDYEAAKGIGWALKTGGRYYPRLLGDWLEQEWLVQNHRRQPSSAAKRYFTCRRRLNANSRIPDGT
jgi:hypothetical protein